MTRYVGAIDQGTTSTRFILFDRDGAIVAVDQREHEQITPNPGWVEHDASEVWRSTREVISGRAREVRHRRDDLEAIGITNQRETTVVWDRESGAPIHNAIVWQDTRTDQLVRALAGEEGLDRLRAHVGLPLSTYFSGPKVTWLLDNVAGARARAENGELAFGTIDSWVFWNLTGGPSGGVHIDRRDQRRRTMLMDLETLDWHEPSLELMGVPRSMLPEIRSCSEAYGRASGTAVGGRPIAGILGDQQAALFGQTCFARGEAKNTYGTGSFLLVNTGREVAARRGAARRASPTGSATASRGMRSRARSRSRARVQWLRDRLGLIDSAPGWRSWRAPSRTTAGSTSCRRSPASSRRTGATTHAASSSA